MLTNFQTWTGRFICAELDSTLIIGDRENAGGWEEFTVEPQGENIVAFRTAHGTYLCAEPNGKILHRHPSYTPGAPPAAWETYRVHQLGDNQVALQTAFDTFIVAEHPQTPGVKPYTIRHRTPGGDGPGAWETFNVTPWWKASTNPGTHPDPIRGAVRLSDGGRRGLADDTGERLLFGVHAGDLLSRYLNGDKAFVEAQLAFFMSQGVHFIRTWTYLWGNWWATAPRPGECHPGRPGYWRAVEEFSALCRKYQIQWLVSQGDLFRDPSSIQSKQSFMRDLAQALGGTDLVIGVDAGNENASAGDPSPETMARVLDPFLEVFKPALISSTSNDENDLNRYVSRVCTVVDSHHGRWHYTMAIERAWTAGYWDGKFRPYLVSSEPVGVGCQEYSGDIRVGHHISATANPRDWDDLESMGVLAAAHYVSRQAYVLMTSPGVISDEPFSNYPAIALSGAIARRLPRNIQTYRVFHGGENRSFSPDRILAVPASGRARCEHSASGNSYVVLVHGESGTHQCRAVNGFSGVQINLGTGEETPVAFRAGEYIPVSFRRGTLYIGERV